MAAVAEGAAVAQQLPVFNADAHSQRVIFNGLPTTFEVYSNPVDAKDYTLNMIIDLSKNVIENSVLSSADDADFVEFSSRVSEFQDPAFALFYLLNQEIDQDSLDIGEWMDKICDKFPQFKEDGNALNLYKGAWDLVEGTEVQGPGSMMYHAFRADGTELEHEGHKYTYKVNANVIRQVLINALTILGSGPNATASAKTVLVAANALKENHADQFMSLENVIPTEHLFVRTEVAAADGASADA